MRTTPTSSPFTGNLGGHYGDATLNDMLTSFEDELAKIAEAQTLMQHPAGQSVAKPSMKRWLKNTAIIGGGVAGGTAAGMLTGKTLRHLGGARWASMSPAAKKMILTPVIASAGIGTAVAMEKMMHERKAADLG